MPPSNPYATPPQSRMERPEREAELVRGNWSVLRLIPAVLLMLVALAAIGIAVVAWLAFGSQLANRYDPDIVLAVGLLTFVPTVYGLAVALLATLAAWSWLKRRWRRAITASLLVVFLAVVLPVGLFVALDLLIGRQ